MGGRDTKGRGAPLARPHARHARGSPALRAVRTLERDEPPQCTSERTTGNGGGGREARDPRHRGAIPRPPSPRLGQDAQATQEARSRGAAGPKYDINAGRRGPRAWPRAERARHVCGTWRGETCACACAQEPRDLVARAERGGPGGNASQRGVPRGSTLVLFGATLCQGAPLSGKGPRVCGVEVARSEARPGLGPRGRGCVGC